MIAILAFLSMFVASNGSNGSNVSPLCLESDEEESRHLSPRGYGYAHPFLPFLEPLSILAVLGFLAFLVQTFHAMYHTHNNNNAGLVGGLLNNVLPGHRKKLEAESRQNENILNAIHFYEELNRRKKRKKRTKFAQGGNVKSPTPPE